MRKKIANWLKATATHKLIGNLFLVFFIIEIALVIIRETSPKAFYNILVIVSSLPLIFYAMISGVIFTIKSEVSFSSQKSIAKGESAIMIGWIIVVCSVAFLFILICASVDFLVM
jgi:hypothetical protein